ncbi:hypothetical protein [Dactylosporangium salmoneum]
MGHLCPDSAMMVSRSTVTVQLSQPDLVLRRRPRSGSPRLTFAAAAIRFYLQHPEQRPAIGTPDGYARPEAAVHEAP